MTCSLLQVVVTPGQPTVSLPTQPAPQRLVVAASGASQPQQILRTGEIESSNTDILYHVLAGAMVMSGGQRLVGPGGQVIVAAPGQQLVRTSGGQITLSYLIS